MRWFMAIFTHPWMRVVMITLFVGMLSYLAGFYLHQWRADPQPPLADHVHNSMPSMEAPTTIVGVARADFALPDLNGQMHSIDQWNGKVLWINFWATWCPPCVKEIPDLLALRERFSNDDFEVIGIAIDQPEAVQTFVDDYQVSYPILVGGADAQEVARQYGNQLGGLPFSVIVDADGTVRQLIPRAVNETQMLNLLSPYMSAK